MPDLGTKHECSNCGAKFYDLGKPEPLCPKCGAAQGETLEKAAAAEAAKTAAAAAKAARRRRKTESAIAPSAAESDSGDGEAAEIDDEDLEEEEIDDEDLEVLADESDEDEDDDD